MIDGIIGFILLTAIPGGIIYAIHEDKKEAKECQEIHHGKDWKTETPLTTTDDGCVVKEIRLLSGESCYTKQKFYVTNCAGICWDTGGKFSRRECTENK